MKQMSKTSNVQTSKPNASTSVHCVKNTTYQCVTEMPEPFHTSVTQSCRTPLNQFCSVQTFQESRHSQSKDGLSARRPCSRLKTAANASTWEDFDQSSNRPSKKNQGLANYLLHEIGMVVQQMPRMNRDKITYLDFLEMLRELNMIQPSYEPMANNDSVSKLWGLLLSGTKDNFTCLPNFAIIVLAILNVRAKPKSIRDFLQSMLGSSSQPQNSSHNFSKKQNQSCSGFKLTKNKDGVFDLSAQEVEGLYVMFKELRVTRMFLGRISKKTELIQQKTQRYSQHSFKPNISKKSLNLAKNRKPKDNSVSNQETYRLQKQEKQLQECSFQPNIHRAASFSKFAGTNRSKALYQQCTSREKDRRDRPADEIQLQKNQEHFTFKPKIVDQPRSEAPRNPIGGQSKQLDRMLKARIQKEVKKEAISRGMPYNPKEIDKLRKQVAVSITTNKPQMKKKGVVQVVQTPAQSDKQNQERCNKTGQAKQGVLKEQLNPRKQIFTFEVYLTEDTCFDKITIFQGDDIDQVSHNFIKKHDLKPQMQAKLVESLKANLQRIQQAQREGLCRIDQQSIQYSVQIDPKTCNYLV